MAINKASDKSERALGLVWSTIHMAQSGGKRDKRQATQRPPSQTAPVPFFQNRAQLVTVIISVASLIGGVAFFFGALNMKTDFGERIAKVESRLDLVDYFARKQLTAQGQKLLGMDAVQVALVNQKSNIFFPITPKPPPLPLSVPTGQKELLVTYELEGIRDNSVIFRAQIEEEIHGKVRRVLYDQRFQIKFPTIEEKRAFYDIKFDDDKGFSSPPVRIEIVIIDQVSPDTLAVAVGMRWTPKDDKASYNSYFMV